MVERRGRARFAQQLLQTVAAARGGDELERDRPIEHDVVGQADLAHPAPSKGLDDAIARAAGRGEGHRIPAAYPELMPRRCAVYSRRARTPTMPIRRSLPSFGSRDAITLTRREMLASLAGLMVTRHA